jgi:hypothetical protein
MRRAIWMALAFMGTAPLVALAQQTGGTQAPATQQPTGSPSGTASSQQGQDGAPLQRPDAQGGQGLMGGAGTGGTGGTVGPTYRGTTEITPPASPPLDVGTRGGPEPSDEAMRRELATLRQRVANLEAQVGDLRRGTGGGGTGGGGSTETANIQVRGPVAVATVTFDGTVRDVTPNRIIIVDNSDGSVYSSVIDNQTQVFEGQELNRISPRQLAEGTPVRASLDLISGVEHARNIVALEPEQQQSRQRQGEPRGQSRQQSPSPQPRIEVPRRGGGMR